MTLTPRCHYCGGPTVPHCKTGQCTWRKCLDRKICRGTGDPVRRRWMGSVPPEE